MFGSSFLSISQRKIALSLVLVVFLVYDINQKGYRCYHHVTKKLYVSRHVTFLEHLPYFSLPPKTALVAKEDLVKIDPLPSNVPTKYISTLELHVVSSAPPPFTLFLPPYSYFCRTAAPPGSTAPPTTFLDLVYLLLPTLARLTAGILLVIVIYW